MILFANGISGTKIFKSYNGTNVSGLYKIYRILFVGVHLIEPCNSLLLDASCVEYIGS